MREITLNENDAGKRLDRFLAAFLPHLPPSLLARLIRKKYFKINGARVSDPSVRLAAGDVLAMYLSDELLEPKSEKESWQFHDGTLEGVVYEDENLLLVDKKPGVVVHEDNSKSPDTLIARILAYLKAKGEWDPADEHSFVPALCNRIDRNTGGLVIAAKNAAALRDMNEIIRTHQVNKSYLCLTAAPPKPAAGRIESYLLKHEDENRVTVHTHPVPGGRYAATRYRTLEPWPNGLTLVECTLETGRTHQIRAQMASIGAPLAGDTKYGRGGGVDGGQALYAVRLDFSPLTDGGVLNYLRGRVFSLSSVTLAGREILVPAPKESRGKQRIPQDNRGNGRTSRV